MNNFNDNYSKDNMKDIRNILFRAKIKSLKEKNKEIDYTLKQKEKLKYGLDIVSINIKKSKFRFL